MRLKKTEDQTFCGDERIYYCIREAVVYQYFFFNFDIYCLYEGNIRCTLVQASKSPPFFFEEEEEEARERGIRERNRGVNVGRE